MRHLTSRVFYVVFASLLLLFVLIFLAVKSYLSSQVALPSNRLHVGIWSAKGAYIISISKQAGQNYILQYTHADTIQIPGGLKKYKVGALGKVAKLEKDDLLIKKALSQLSGIPLDGVLYDASEEIYYSDSYPAKDIPAVVDDARAYLYGAGDMSFFDRVYVGRVFSSFRNSNTRLYGSTKPQDSVFYDRRFRNEKKLVQIQYQKSQHTAVFISKLLENVGVRVSDISQDQNPTTGCVVIENGGQFSDTSRYLAAYFHCSLKTGETGLYEVIFNLGTIESSWSI